MNRHVRYLLQGLVLIGPLAVTMFVVVRAALWLDREVLWLLARVVRVERPEIVLPPLRGLGIAIAIVAIYLFGRLGSVWGFRIMVQLVERALSHIPLLKTLYGALKDMTQFVLGEKRRAGKPVTFSPLGADLKMMGLITRETPLPGMPTDKEQLACVYFPLSYQLGGLTLLVPADRLQPIDLDGAALLRLVITGGVASAEEAAPQQPSAAGEKATSDQC